MPSRVADRYKSKYAVIFTRSQATFDNPALAQEKTFPTK